MLLFVLKHLKSELLEVLPIKNQPLFHKAVLSDIINNIKSCQLSHVSYQIGFMRIDFCIDDSSVQKALHIVKVLT
jgi:hypothetical protein